MNGESHYHDAREVNGAATYRDLDELRRQVQRLETAVASLRQENALLRGQQAGTAASLSRHVKATEQLAATVAVMSGSVGDIAEILERSHL